MMYRTCPDCRTKQFCKNATRCFFGDLTEEQIAELNACSSPGPTTTPVEKREEDVATDGIPFNVNEYVRVKLTDIGVKIYEGHYASYGIVNHAPEDRVLKEQLWSLMQIFGASMGPGRAVPFETNIHILAEPQPISNLLVCGKCATFQEAALEMVKAWRSKEASHIESCVYKICATQLAALLEGKS